MTGWLVAISLACSTPEPAAAVVPPPIEVDPDAARLADQALGRPHQVAHLLSFPTPAGAEAAAVALSSHGMRVESSSEGEAWTVEALETLTLTAAAVADRREALEALAQGYGGTYEGWAAEVLP